MLVTNMHVMAGKGDNDEYQEPSGDEEMYQDLLNPDEKVVFLTCVGYDAQHRPS